MSVIDMAVAVPGRRVAQPGAHRMALGLMVASGFAALGYQIVWTQQAALWLGHESPSTTHVYLEADLAMKERALSRLQPPTRSAARYKPPDRLIQFLQGL